ncbi:toxin-antitoxin system YwqK family antitoxin [Parafilimonas sp.]|uniref:toxin-antitoxin system YwqK family antitoxin n=1 Tax=Parafilimonas sp. TaxID=1969739 RepID=UPI0039E39333
MKCNKGLLALVSMFIMQHAFSQCKTYRLSSRNDTINCTDFNNLKQGKWAVRVEDNHGEPGYQEEGYYKDDKKEGAWTRFNLMGDVIAQEQYKWGYKDGICRYYNLMGLIREESWRATNPKDPYDTVRAYHLDNPDKYDLKIIKVDASTVRHGTWTYYDPQQGTITKTEEYVIDQLIPAKKANAVMLNDSSTVKNPADSLADANKKKPPEVLEWEKKNQKKKIKVRDGATGVN